MRFYISARPFGVSARLDMSEYQAATPMFEILRRHPPVTVDQGDSIHQVMQGVDATPSWLLVLLVYLRNDQRDHGSPVDDK